MLLSHNIACVFRGGLGGHASKWFYNFNKYFIASNIITTGIAYAINLISIYPAPINTAILAIPNIVNNTPKTLIIKVNIITTPFIIVDVNKAKSKRLRRVNYLLIIIDFFYLLNMLLYGIIHLLYQHHIL